MLIDIAVITSVKNHLRSTPLHYAERALMGEGVDAPFLFSPEIQGKSYPR